MTKILLDMNYPAFQEQLFGIEKQEQRALLTTLKIINHFHLRDESLIIATRSRISS